MRSKFHVNFLKDFLVWWKYGMLIFLFQEEDLYEIDIPLSFVASVGTRVHGLACWFDVLFNGRSVYLSIYWKFCWLVIFAESQHPFRFVFRYSKSAMLYCSTVQRWLTTAPGSPTTHWYQLRCVLSQPLYVMAGQEITGRLHLVAHSSQSYTIYLTMSG